MRPSPVLPFPSGRLVRPVPPRLRPAVLGAGLLLFLLLPSAYAQPSAAPGYAPAVRQARALVVERMEAEAVPGLTVAVAVEGRVVWSEGFGYADVENRVPVTPLTKMRIGSVSKSMTATALARLYEAGRVDLDAPIQTYTPDFPEKRGPISIRQLAGHLAGIRHYRGDEMYSAVYYPTVADGLSIFAADTLLFEPGTRYSYSSYGWNLLSAALESAGGQPFLSLMDELVFYPMELRHTLAEHMDSLITYRTRYYVRDDAGTVLNAPYVDNSYKWAGGGFLSTAEDVVRFGVALLADGYWRPETRTLFFTSQRLASGEETGYGLGFRTQQDADGRRLVGHTGGSIGGSTRFLMYPDDAVVIAIISNLSNVDYDDLDSRIGALFIDARSSGASEP